MVSGLGVSGRLILLVDQKVEWWYSNLDRDRQLEYGSR